MAPGTPGVSPARPPDKASGDDSEAISITSASAADDDDTPPALLEASEGTEEELEGAETDLRSLALARRRGGRPASAERLYIVTYDIKSPKRWRQVFRTMKGYGRWLQLSVFQCRLTGRRRADLGAALEQLIHHHEDHVIILDLGPADRIDPRVESFGKTFTPVTRQAIIV